MSKFKRSGRCWPPVRPNCQNLSIILPLFQWQSDLLSICSWQCYLFRYIINCSRQKYG